MKKFKPRGIFVLALVGGLPAVLILGSRAQAQYRTTNNDGHANDASNRLGSGGYNSPSSLSNAASLGDQVLTGNVSGLNYFHGRSQTFDPNNFHGSTGTGNSDRLNAIAGPVNYAKPSNGQPNYTSYYSSAQLNTAPPANYVTTPGGQGYVPAPTVSPLTPSPDTRVNNGDVNSNAANNNLPTPGELNVVGPVDTSGAASMYSMSPLYGMRQDMNSDPNQSSFLSKTSNSHMTTPADRARMDNNAILKMRDELNQTVVPGNQPVQQPGTPAGTPGAVSLSQNQQVTDTASSASKLTGGSALNAPVTNQQFGGDLSSGQSLQNQLMIAPGKQSKQLAELEKRYAGSKEKLTDVEAADRMNKELRAQNAKPAVGDASADKTIRPPGIGGGGMIGTSAPMKQQDAAPTTQSIKPVLRGPETADQTEQPYIITSLATGMPAAGLANLMKTAEDQMRQGKFTEAVASYETAEQVAPNNPFVFLGRGIAEMGASYYGKADMDLGRAITSEPALLAGRYDLKGFLGEDRLNFVQKDLQDISDHEKGARPLVLLAYIAHNTGDDAAAARDLNDAAARGGYQQLVDLMQIAWGLKATAK